MTRYLLTLLGLVVMVMCVSDRAAAEVVPREMIDRGVLPADEPVENGWEIDLYDNPVKAYQHDNLHLYLGEKTDRYLECGFMKLTHGVYRPFQKDFMGKPTVVVDAYLMNEPLNAYGLFTVERNRENKLASIGGCCNLGAREAVLWKGGYFVRVKLIADVENGEEVLTKFATKTAENIQGVTAIPELGWFPADKRTASGDQYVVKDLLGFGFLGRGVTVEYDLEGGKATMFLVLAPGAAKGDGHALDAATAYLELRDALVKDGSTPMVLPGPWDSGYRATEGKLGRGLVARKGRYILGIFGAPDEQTAIEMTSALVKALK